MIQINRKYIPLITAPTRYYVLTGGRGSAKSFSASLLFTKLCLEENQRILFTRYTMTAAHLSIIPEFIEKIDLLNANHLFHVNKHAIKCKSNTSEILFRGIKTSSGEQTASLKSIQGVTTWIVDEAEELVNENIFTKIDLSIRTKGVQNRVVLIMNPNTKEHWIYKRFFEDAGVPEGFNGIKGDTTYIHTTYLDNIKNLDESFLAQIEHIKATNTPKFNNVILGGWLNKSESVIFTNWKIGEFDKTLTSVYGQDYGFSIDASVLVNVAIDRKLKRIYIDECFYRAGMSTSDLERENKAEAKDKLIVADSSEPRLIDELRKTGLNIIGTNKIAVIEGLAIMLDYELIITERSVNIVKELNNYSWNDKKSGTPKDMFNHAIDAIRYSIVYQLINGDFKRNKIISMKSVRR